MRFFEFSKSREYPLKEKTKQNSLSVPRALVPKVHSFPIPLKRYLFSNKVYPRLEKNLCIQPEVCFEHWSTLYNYFFPTITENLKWGYKNGALYVCLFSAYFTE